MAEQKDVCSPLLIKTPKSKLTAEQPSTKKHRNLPKNISYSQRQRRSHNEMVGGGAIMIKSNPIPAGWATQKLENNYTTEVFPLE